MNIKIMSQRVEYLLKKGIITDHFLLKTWEEIAGSALVIRNKIMKMEISKQGTRYAGIVDLLEILKKDEKRAVVATIEHLRNCHTIT